MGFIDLPPDGFNELRLCRSGPMIYNRHDIYVGGSLRKYGEFSYAETVVFSQLIQRGSVVVEVGANIGAHTVDLSRLAGLEGQVYAFEPQRIPFQTLCANLALNSCANVLAKQEALGAEPGAIVVPELDPKVRSNFGGLSLVGAATGETVPLKPLDALDLPACHFLKADVEGMEVDVVRGGLRTIDMYRPLMYLENDREEHSADLLGLAMDLDYEVYWHFAPLFNPGNFAGDQENIFPRIVSINVLCVPRERRIDVQGVRKVQSRHESWRSAT
jgi:FkbM family methyltransferase